MIKKVTPKDKEPWPLETRVDEHGNRIVPAFTLHRMQDEHYVYWTVNLHDHMLANDEKSMMQLFHDRESAERFIAEHKNKKPQ
jgi:hypothetical protein